MTTAERERFVLEVLDALSDPRLAMSEGRPHRRAKGRALDMLGLHFRAKGRAVYLAEEMAVLYPGEASFSPDVLAVVGVEEPEDDARMAWVVVEEGKGLDLALEVLHAGDRAKDLVDNVERYARLGIPEYFVYDIARQRIHAFRLEGSKRYQPVVPQAGLYRSTVLGLDLGIVEGSLRFFDGAAELYDTAHLLRRLRGMVERLEARSEEAEAATSKAEAATLAVLREAIETILAARGMECSPATRERLVGCAAPDVLRRWMQRAATVRAAAEVFADD